MTAELNDVLISATQLTIFFHMVKKNQYTTCSILKPYEEQDDIRMTAREGHVIPKQKFNKI